jgi:hypothetical protein
LLEDCLYPYPHSVSPFHKLTMIHETKI